MKTNQLICSSFLLLALASENLLAEPLNSDQNPALRYYQAFLTAPEISEADFDYLATNYWWSQTLPSRFGELVGRYDAEFDLVRQASTCSLPCNWGIDMSQGPATRLPHLARCKAVMLGARFRVAWHLQHQRQAEAREDLLAAFTLARNISRDGTLISVLVQIAAEAIACDTIAENFGRFSPETLRQIVAGIDAAPAPGTVSGSVAVEKTSFHDWLVNKILELQKLNPGDDAKVMAAIHELLPDLVEGEANQPQSGLWEQLNKAGGNSSEGLLKLLRNDDEAYQRLAALTALPYAEFDAQSKQFATDFQNAQNPLLSQAFPAYLKAKRREVKIRVWLAMLHTAVEYKLHGDAALLSVNDPCGQGPFAFQHFIFEGVDRGFQLKSAYEGSGFPESLIFVEKSGTPFLVDGPHVGEARQLPANQK